MENKEKKINKKALIPVIILATIITALLIAVIVKLLSGGDKVPTAGELDISETVDTSIEVETRSFLLKTGETQKIALQEPGVTFESSNTAVATVAEDGTVTAVAPGMALITITQGEKTGYCGVIVDGIGEFVDISSKSATGLFEQMALYETVEIEGMAVDAENNAIYFSQNYGITDYTPLNADLIVTQAKLSDNTWTRGSYMRFYLSGEGHFDVDNGTVWTESGATYVGLGKTISSISWEDEGFYQESFGKTYNIGELDGTRLTVDSENNMAAVYDAENKQYLIYDSSALSEEASNPYLHAVVCADDQKPVAGADDSDGNYNSSIAGFSLADGFIYQFSGSRTQMYVSVFDLSGQLQYCKKLDIQTENGDGSPVGIDVENGEVYVGLQSGDSATCFYANAWKY